MDQLSGGGTALRRVAAQGETSSVLMVRQWRFPRFRPDGCRFASRRMYGGADSETRGLDTASLDGGYVNDLLGCAFCGEFSAD